MTVNWSYVMSKIKAPYLTWTDVCISDAISFCYPKLNLYKYNYSELNRLVKYSQQSSK